MTHTITLTDQQLNHVIAALRFLGAHLHPASQADASWVHDIATNGGDDVLMDIVEIEQFAVSLNTGDLDTGHCTECGRGDVPAGDGLCFDCTPVLLLPDPNEIEIEIDPEDAAAADGLPDGALEHMEPLP